MEWMLQVVDEMDDALGAVKHRWLGLRIELGVPLRPRFGIASVAVGAAFAVASGFASVAVGASFAVGFGIASAAVGAALAMGSGAAP